MSFYGGLKDTATRLVDSYGASLTFTRRTAGAYDPATGTASTTETTFTGQAVEVAYKAIEIDGERIKQADKKMICSAMDTPPEIGDLLSVSGVNYQILSVSPKSPAGTVLTYELQVRI